MTARWAPGLVVGAAALLVAGAVAAPSSAEAFGGGSGGGGGTVRLVSGSCALAAWSSGYGISCTAATSGTGSVMDLLAGDPVPTCWDTAPEAGFVPLREEDGPGSWWLRTCLVGFDPAAPVSGASFSHEYVFLPPGDERTLTPGQQAFVSTLTRGATIPLPVVRVTPTPTPRVGDEVAFSVPAQYATAETISLGGQSMRGVMTHLQVYPVGGTRTVVSCAGAGVEVSATDTPASRPDACWYRYTRSSHGAGGVPGAITGSGGGADSTDSADSADRYPVRVVATWSVQRSDDGGATWTPVGTFQREALDPVRVTEIQTLVVP